MYMPVLGACAWCLYLVLILVVYTWCLYLVFVLGSHTSCLYLVLVRCLCLVLVLYVYPVVSVPSCPSPSSFRRRRPFSVRPFRRFRPVVCVVVPCPTAPSSVLCPSIPSSFLSSSIIYHWTPTPGKSVRSCGIDTDVNTYKYTYMFECIYKIYL